MSLKAFQIKLGGKTYSYRQGKPLELNKVKSFFNKKYSVLKLWNGNRHTLGILQQKNIKYFLKLAPTEGISIVTKIEYEWNVQFNILTTQQQTRFRVPTVFESGVYDDNLFYLITEYFDGTPLALYPSKMEINSIFIRSVDKIISFSEFIQSLSFKNLLFQEPKNHQEWFIEKAAQWFHDIPPNIVRSYELRKILNLVIYNSSSLRLFPRHGDFAPWHIFLLSNGNIGLIDGEHALKKSVEYYDIGYFIQRIFCELENQELSEMIVEKLKKRNYDMKKLKTILYARAIGGFLDKSLTEKKDYFIMKNFIEWIKCLS